MATVQGTALWPARRVALAARTDETSPAIRPLAPGWPYFFGTVQPLDQSRVPVGQA